MVKTEVETVTVALPAELVTRVRGALEGSGSLSNEEVISDALQDWKKTKEGHGEDAEYLRAAWKEAKDRNGPYFPAEEVFERLRARYQGMIDEAAKTK